MSSARTLRDDVRYRIIILVPTRQWQEVVPSTTARVESSDTKPIDRAPRSIQQGVETVTSLGVRGAVVCCEKIRNNACNFKFRRIPPMLTNAIRQVNVCVCVCVCVFVCVCV